MSSIPWHRSPKYGGSHKHLYPVRERGNWMHFPPLKQCFSLQMLTTSIQENMLLIYNFEFSWLEFVHNSDYVFLPSNHFYSESSTSLFRWTKRPLGIFEEVVIGFTMHSTWHDINSRLNKCDAGIFAFPLSSFKWQLSLSKFNSCSNTLPHSALQTRFWDLH